MFLSEPIPTITVLLFIKICCSSNGLPHQPFYLRNKGKVQNMDRVLQKKIWTRSVDFLWIITSKSEEICNVNTWKYSGAKI